MSSFLNEKSILVTGGTGTFGRSFIRRLLRDCQPRKVIVFSRDEWKQWEMQQSDPLFRSDCLRYFLGDVRDQQRLCRAFQDVDLVVHAAALKQVPAAEYNPCEFVKTNVIGAMQLIEAAIDAGVQKVIALSTDKAVNPVNLYGATKLCADKLFVAGNVYVGKRGYPQFSVVRYGNVLGSRGSALAYWQQLVAEGATELPITDPEMTRFWVTIEQAVEFVISSFEQMQGGEIFVPKCPSTKIVDLAASVAPQLPQRVTGIRPGEKVHEVLIAPEDAHRTRAHPGHYVIYSKVIEREALGGEPVENGFSYASHTNDWWFSAAELNQLAAQF